MGVAGRKPVPGGEVVEARKGTITGDVVEMSAPDDLTDEAKMLWDVAVTDLIAMKMFRISDAPMLAEFVSALSMARAFRRQLDALEPEIATQLEQRNYDAAGALSEIAKRARSGYVQTLKLAQSIGGDFGMTPVARLRLGLIAGQAAVSLHGLFGGTDAGSS